MIETDSASETSADLRTPAWLLAAKEFAERLFSYKLTESALSFTGVLISP
jgi:hypothetical protein